MTNAELQMKKIVICKYCGQPEYYGDMRWLSGKCCCRNCYRADWEKENNKPYIWDDLNGRRPTMEEFKAEQGKTEIQEAVAKAKALQDFCWRQTCETCYFRESLNEKEKWCGLNFPKTWVTPEAKIYKEAAEAFYFGLIEGLKGTDGSEDDRK